MVDMHIHTKNSDGEHSVNKIVEKIKINNIKIFSITDHDNIKSCYEMEKIGLPCDTIYIPGIEFSSKLKNYKCHILGYNFDYTNQDIINECNKIKNKRIDKITTMIENIQNNFKIEITDEEKSQILNKNGTVGRPDLYKILIKKVTGTKEEIFNKYLIPPANKNHRSEAEDIINIIHAANGKAIIAHPKEIEEENQIDLEDVIKYFLEIGIDGIELYHSIHSLKEIKKYLQLAKKYNLLTTAGSDYHGHIIKPDIDLGYTTKQKIKIYPDEINFKY